MKKRGFLFDLDGVIVSTDRYHYQAWKKIADQEEIYFDEKINDQLRGISREQSLEIILQHSVKDYTEEEKHHLTETKNTFYRELLEKMTPEAVSAEVRDTLKKLREDHYRLAIASSSKNAKLILERIGLTDWFDNITDGTCITRSKPDPEVFVKAAQALGLSPEECYVVEDAAAGLQAAKAGGMTAVGFGEAGNSGEADYAVKSFSELLKLTDRRTEWKNM